MKPLLSTIARWGIGSFAVTAAGFAGIQLSAQAIASHNSNAPVSYAADRIELQDRENRVVLSGNVQITQAGLGLSAARTIVSYSDAGSLSIQRIMATGGVTVSRGNERARAQWHRRRTGPSRDAAYGDGCRVSPVLPRPAAQRQASLLALRS